ncbi:hypothetical protein ACVIGV_005300 [Rhizobium leguminosarum]
MPRHLNPEDNWRHGCSGAATKFIGRQRPTRKDQQQGDPYLRRLLVVGAHAVLRFSRKAEVAMRWAAERRGKPGMIVSDNGTELTSNAILAWSRDHKVEWHYIAPGKPMQTLYVVSTVECATSCSTKACSSVSIMPEAPLPNGRTTQPFPAALIGRTQNPGRLCQDHRRSGSNTAQDESFAFPPVAHTVPIGVFKTDLNPSNWTVFG